jgi:hypothetical protein
MYLLKKTKKTDSVQVKPSTNKVIV